MRLAISWLALTVLGVAPHAFAAPSTPPYLRTSLDDETTPTTPAGPRRIRSTLDDESRQSHAAFPLDPEGRLIRLSLAEGAASYGRLSTTRESSRRIRVTLD